MADATAHVDDMCHGVGLMHDQLRRWKIDGETKWRNSTNGVRHDGDLHCVTYAARWGSSPSGGGLFLDRRSISVVLSLDNI